MDVKILCFAGSLRQGSLNKKYVLVAKDHLATIADAQVEFVDLNDYPLPVYNQDIENKGFPEAVARLAAEV